MKTKTINDLMEWAKKEVELSKSNTQNEKFGVNFIGASKDEIDSIFDAAYDIYCYFLERTVNTLSLRAVISIFKQLLYERPLEPIENLEDEWVLVGGIDANGYCSSIYSSKRRPSLFKKVVKDQESGIETVKFADTDRYICIDVNTNKKHIGEIGGIILDEMIPISFPYMPIEEIKIFTEEFAYYDKVDTYGVLYFKLEDARMVEVNRFFKSDCKTGEYVEIDKHEYFARRKKAESKNSHIKGE